MKARHLIANVSFGPETLKAIGQAFDEAWASIEKDIGCDQERETFRFKLATALLSVASDESRDVKLLKKARSKKWLATIAGNIRGQASNSETSAKCARLSQEGSREDDV